jgi:hypothetical protein
LIAAALAGLLNVRGRIGHYSVMTANGRELTFDLIGPRLTPKPVPATPPGLEAATRLAGAPPMVVHRPDQMTARAMGVRAGDAILVRAEGVPAGWRTAHLEPGPLFEAAVGDVRAARGIARAA